LILPPNKTIPKGVTAVPGHNTVPRGKLNLFSIIGLYYFYFILFYFIFFEKIK